VFPFKHFAIFAGITNMAGTFGAMCGGFPIAKSVNTLGWRETILILAAIGVVLLVAAFCIIPKRMKAFDGGSTHSFKSIFMKVVKNRQIILSGLVGGFMYLPISVFSELWAIPFFMTKYNINNETASIGSSILFVGFAIGSIAMAIIAKKINGYVKTIRFSSICVALLFIPLIYVDNIYLSFFTVFLIGIFTGAQVMIFTCAKNNESEKNSGTTVAFANFLVMLAGSIFQPVLGVLLDIFWTGKFSHDGTRLYEIVSYQKAIITLPICLVAAYILSIFIKETIHKEEKVLNNF
jgi:fucose permease